MTDLDNLERLAEAATAGPWQWVNPDTDEIRQPGEFRSSLRTIEEFKTLSGFTLPRFIFDADEIREDADADFIAAADPATILSLIRRVREAERDAARFVFEHSAPQAMLEIELQAIAFSEPLPIDWWREKIDTAALSNEEKNHMRNKHADAFLNARGQGK